MEKLQALLVLHKKKTMVSPPPNITGKANGKIQGKAALLNIREYISAVAALIHYLRQMSTKVAIIHLDYLALIISLSYPMSKSQNLIGGWSWETYTIDNTSLQEVLQIRTVYGEENEKRERKTVVN